jgi:hypothetical protein
MSSAGTDARPYGLSVFKYFFVTFLYRKVTKRIARIKEVGLRLGSAETADPRGPSLCRWSRQEIYNG